MGEIFLCLTYIVTKEHACPTFSSNLSKNKYLFIQYLIY